MALTRDQVFKAAEALAAKGENPTLESVRALVGGGSFSTIGKWVKEWKQSPDRGKARPPLPDAVKEATLRFGAEIWALALKEAEKAVAARYGGKTGMAGGGGGPALSGEHAPAPDQG